MKFEEHRALLHFILLAVVLLSLFVLLYLLEFLALTGCEFEERIYSDSETMNSLTASFYILCALTGLVTPFLFTSLFISAPEIYIYIYIGIRIFICICVTLRSFCYCCAAKVEIFFKFGGVELISILIFMLFRF